jgi:hypothetical protein
MRLARLHGGSMMIISGAFALASAANQGVAGAVVGLLIALAGAGEVHGASVLANGRTDGTRWLIGAQLYLLLVMLAYCVYSVQTLNVAELQAQFIDAQKSLPDEFKKVLFPDDMPLTPALIKASYTQSFMLVALGSIIYQGLMARYYAKRRVAIELALLPDDAGLRD